MFFFCVVNGGGPHLPHERRVIHVTSRTPAEIASTLHRRFGGSKAWKTLRDLLGSDAFHVISCICLYPTDTGVNDQLPIFLHLNTSSFSMRNHIDIDVLLYCRCFVKAIHVTMCTAASGATGPSSRTPRAARRRPAAAPGAGLWALEVVEVGVGGSEDEDIFSGKFLQNNVLPFPTQKNIVTLYYSLSQGLEAPDYRETHLHLIGIHESASRCLDRAGPRRCRRPREAAPRVPRAAGRRSTRCLAEGVGAAALDAPRPRSDLDT